jgi:protoheme IX farnesyltransferase
VKAEVAGGTLLGDLVQMSKVRINLLALVTVFAGFALGVSTSPQGSLSLLLSPQYSWLLFHVLVGSFVLASASSMLNQYIERDADALMERTSSRPLPAGRFSPPLARSLGVVLTLAGLVYLVVLVNPLCAAVSAVTTGVYVFFYTPLKRVTSFSLLVGAFAGALPPVIGLTAATGELVSAGWSIFTIQFIWQIPHFLAIAWMYREDYERAGFPMLTVVDKKGSATALQVVGWTLALVPASLMPAAVFGFAGSFYFWTALGSSLVFLAFAVCFGVTRTRKTARWVVLVSVVYLPVLFIVLVLGARRGEIW